MALNHIRGVYAPGVSSCTILKFSFVSGSQTGGAWNGTATSSEDNTDESAATGMVQQI